MATLDLTKAVDRVRLACGDYSDFPVLTDAMFHYALDKNEANEEKATKDCAYWILGALSQRGDYRLDRIQILGGSDVYSNYLSFIKTVITNPASALNAVQIYAAGVDSEDYYNNLLDDTVLHRRPTNPYSYIKGLWNPYWSA